jgi:hypothetical protein
MIHNRCIPAAGYVRQLTAATGRCLIALREGLSNWGKPNWAEITEGLSVWYEFYPLFDEKRLLFFIGWDITKGAPTEGCMPSWRRKRAKRGTLPLRGATYQKTLEKAWRSLVAKDGSQHGFLDGTMFEYLMPNCFCRLS